MMNLAALSTPPPGVEPATGLIAGLDQCLALGFARLGPTQHEALESLVGTFAGTPLEAPLSAATPAMRRSEFLVKHFCSLAAARAALQGAQYDALFRQAATALGRTGPMAAAEAPKPLTPQGHHTAWLTSTQQWLMELALAGFAHLKAEAVTPFSATLEQIQSDPKLTRTAALLTGFFVELLAAQPSNGDSVPNLRWADLWTRAMLLAQSPPASEAGHSVSGTFSPLGADMRFHPHFANIVIYGLLDTGKQRRVVRVPLSSYKVDVVTTNEIWQLFRPAADPLLESLASKKSLAVSNMQLLSTGDLLWTGKAKTGAAFDAMAVGAAAAGAGTEPLPPLPPLVRHPVQLGELVHLESYSVRKSTRPEMAALGAAADPERLELVASDAVLPIAPERLPAGCEISPKAIQQSSAMIGLLRFDRSLWAVQPLAIRSAEGKKQRVILAGDGALQFCKKDKLKTLATLSERASKLLRQ